MPRIALVAAVLAALFVAACGESRSTRVLTGAAGGAVAGQVIADKPVEGAVAGGSSAPSADGAAPRAGGAAPAIHYQRGMTASPPGGARMRVPKGCGRCFA